jgi:hypothetical protein
MFVSYTRLFSSTFGLFQGTETDQGEYTQKLIDSLPLDKLVLTWIQFLTILQDPSECGDVSVTDKPSPSLQQISFRFRFFFECHNILVNYNLIQI